MFEKLVQYKKQHKKTNVPRGYARDPKLGIWVQWQHPLYKSKNLNTERMNKLESLGFVWGHSFDTQWTENFLRLVAYKKKHNSTNVPNRYAEDDHPLGNWVTSQRTFYKTKLLSIDRINHLESIEDRDQSFCDGAATVPVPTPSPAPGHATVTYEV